jgi:hypothetical protein
MNKLMVLILSVFLFTCAGCQVKDMFIPNGSNPIWGKPSHGLRISIDISKTGFNIGKSVFALISIANVTNKKINYSSIPAFTFNNMQYWCPVNIGIQDPRLPANTPVQLTLPGNGLMKTKIDLSKLKCGQGSSSIWPENTPYSILPIGEYVLRLEIEIIDGADNNWIRSNEVKVKIFK